MHRTTVLLIALVAALALSACHPSRTGYGGPCPPSGTHRYFFKLYALDADLDLEEGSTKEDIEAVMAGHIIESAELMGTYERK